MDLTSTHPSFGSPAVLVILIATPALAHEEPEFSALPPWDATGADSLNVTILGQFRVDSPTGIWGVAAYVDPAGSGEYALSPPTHCTSSTSRLRSLRNA